MSSYWETSIQEILGEHEIFVNGEVLRQIASSVESCASVQSGYSAPVSGVSEVDQLKDEIRKLKNSRACTSCGGAGGALFGAGFSRSSWSDCRHCGGSGMVS